MHSSVENLIKINKEIESNFIDLKEKNKFPKIIAVSKTFGMDKIRPLIEHGHTDFGENKVQEAIEKWTKVLNENDKINLHLIGKLQTNKVKFCLKLFKFIHSLDSEKLAKKIADEQIKQKTKVKLFIQINIGNEQQKSGIYADQVENFYNFCTNLDLDIVGTMCIQPANEDPEKYFMRMMYLNKKLGLKEISMGMSSDYKKAIKFNSTYLRIGSNIFGKRD